MSIVQGSSLFVIFYLQMMYQNGVNGILADEMGLGKTVQVIALICYLTEINVQGPYLIVVPFSTLFNWEAEFKRFAPKIPVVVFTGSKEIRNDLATEIKTKKYRIDGKAAKPVIITAFHTPCNEPRFMNSFTWQYIIVDEGQRIKNHKSKLAV